MTVTIESNAIINANEASIEQLRAALDGIGALLDLLECSNPANLALLPLFLAQQKLALAALTRMEQP